MAAHFSASHAGRLLYFSMCRTLCRILKPNGNQTKTGLGVEALRARLSGRDIAELDQGQEPATSGHDAGHEGD
jgi:hypothetical protein